MGAVGGCLDWPLVEFYKDGSRLSYLKFLIQLARALPRDMKTRPYLVMADTPQLRQMRSWYKEELAPFQMCV